MQDEKMRSKVEPFLKYMYKRIRIVTSILKLWLHQNCRLTVPFFFILSNTNWCYLSWQDFFYSFFLYVKLNFAVLSHYDWWMLQIWTNLWNWKIITIFNSCWILWLMHLNFEWHSINFTLSLSYHVLQLISYESTYI